MLVQMEEFLIEQCCKSTLNNALTAENNPLNNPQPRPLPVRRKLAPFVFTGNDAFALTMYMMKPCTQSGLDCEKRIFNYRLSRNRRISENAFRILANRWRILWPAIRLCPEKVTWLTLAVITKQFPSAKFESCGNIHPT